MRGRHRSRRRPQDGNDEHGDERLLIGRRAVLEALAEGAWTQVATVYVAEESRGAVIDEICAAAAARGVPIEDRPRRELDARARGVRHQGVIALAEAFRYAALEDMVESDQPLLVALDQISDPHNVGAIARSALAFGAAGMILPQDRSASITPTVARASAGAVEHLPIAQITNLARTLAELKEQGLAVLGLAGEGDTSLAGAIEGLFAGASAGRADRPSDREPHRIPNYRGAVLVVGSEGKGLRRLTRLACDRLVRIDMPGPMASLNASVAAGIALFALSQAKQRTG